MMTAKIYNQILTGILFLLLAGTSQAQVKILFDATKAESAANADWVIDADQFNLGWSTGPAVLGGGNEANAQRIPTPAQSGITQSTAENFWKGGISAWGVESVQQGFTVETLPYNGQITYGNSGNLQDLSNYKVFVVCEPNIMFTAAEKTAILQFVQNGGGLFMVSDHNNSDRNSDGDDSPHIWNDLMSNNSIQSNPFGITFDYVDFSVTTSNIPNLPSDPVLHGTMGNVTQAQWSAGTSMTLNPTSNSSVVGVVYKTASYGNTNVMVAHATYGNGKVVAMGDSSPADDGSGDTGDALYDGWVGDANGNHRIMIMNATIWLASSSGTPPTATTVAASGITSSGATLNGTVNPNGTSTNYYFEWGTTTSYGNATTTTSAGSGTSASNVNATLSGLTAGTTYHYRIVATNGAGTTNGSDLTFTTSVALPSVTTTAATSITSTTATSGGNVTSAGGGTVTARGVCWSTTANPVATGSHTTDGTGTGTFTSSITGLSASTLYHVRAYATNSAGTAYGSDLQFTTAALPTLGVTPSNQNVTAAAGSTTFTVTSNSGWTASSSQSWCTVTASGTGNGTITATFSENTVVSSRVANITVTVTGLTPVVVTVTQAAALPALSVSPSSQSVNYLPGSTSFTVTSNTSWTASSDQAWCTATPSGTGNGTITATFQQSTLSTTRTANITVTVTGLTPVVVTVVQAATPPVDFLFTMANDVQTSEKTLEFDLMLMDNDASQPFELATVQAGILVNPSIYNGGTVTATIVAGSSTLNTSQQPTSITFTQSANVIKLASKAPPGAGNGTILSANPLAPSRVCRIKLTNTVAWAQFTPDLTFNFTMTPYATKISQYIAGINTALTVNTTNTFSECLNGLLNPPPALSVAPSNQNVGTASGSTLFNVASNAGWTAVSDASSWCTVTASGYGNGTITASFAENLSATPRVANITVTVTGLAPQVVTVTQDGAVTDKTLNLTVFLEGLYAGSNTMSEARDASGPHWGPAIADKIAVELRSASDYNTLVYTSGDIDLHTDGTATFTFPSAYSGSYYITIRHRNSIETVSANPVSFAGASTSYSFDIGSKAFGSNMIQKPDGAWVVFAGDANQDGLVDAGDMILIDNDAAAFMDGYLLTDANGDGIIDAGDMIIIDNNSSAFVGKLTP